MNTPDPLNTPPTAPVGSRDDSLVTRVIYMVLFAVVFWILCWTLAISTVLQLVLRVLNGKPNADLVKFGASLGRYAQQLIEYLTFGTDRLPFPFTQWPEVSSPQT